MKKLKIYKENGEYVMERVNEFDHATKSFFITENGLIEWIDIFMFLNHLADYELEVSEELRELVIGHIKKNGGESLL